MSGKLLERLEDLPGVASVTLDIDDVENGINVRLEEGADEAEVLERVRSLLVAYGVRSPEQPRLRIGEGRSGAGTRHLGVEVRVTPIKGGARVEVIGKTIRSFRVVPPNPLALAQGLCDAWSQVLGRVPVEISEAGVEQGILTVTAGDGELQRVGRAEVAGGWELALALAVGEAMGVVTPDSRPKDASLTPAAW